MFQRFHLCNKARPSSIINLFRSRGTNVGRGATATKAQKVDVVEPDVEEDEKHGMNIKVHLEDEPQVPSSLNPVEGVVYGEVKPILPVPYTSSDPNIRKIFERPDYLVPTFQMWCAQKGLSGERLDAPVYICHSAGSTEGMKCFAAEFLEIIFNQREAMGLPRYAVFVPAASERERRSRSKAAATSESQEPDKPKTRRRTKRDSDEVLEENVTKAERSRSKSRGKGCVETTEEGGSVVRLTQSKVAKRKASLHDQDLDEENEDEQPIKVRRRSSKVQEEEEEEVTNARRRPLGHAYASPAGVNSKVAAKAGKGDSKYASTDYGKDLDEFSKNRDSVGIKGLIAATKTGKAHSRSWTDEDEEELDEFSKHRVSIGIKGILAATKTTGVEEELDEFSKNRESAGIKGIFAAATKTPSVENKKVSMKVEEELDEFSKNRESAGIKGIFAAATKTPSVENKKVSMKVEEELDE
eukprot:Colp12_sorted_trinity150504_noHs@13121